jgi:alpha-tubulin suppressor-like RCC1 family protein
VGLRTNGTVVAVGYNDDGRCDVGGWTDITQVAAGIYHTVGLKNDGTVVAMGDNASGQCDVGGWTDIVRVAAGMYHTVGLKSDGTVVATGPEIELAKWNLIEATP